MIKASEFKISILLATYNWPSALTLCLESLRSQTDLNFEILIADDGSKEATRSLIHAMSSNFPVKITHLWQEDVGFRKSKILNVAIERATGEYLIFLDSDCIVQSDFVAQHRLLARPSQLITGSRILVSAQTTQSLCPSELSQSVARSSVDRLIRTVNLLRLRLQRGINKLLPLLIKLPHNRFRSYPAYVWRRIKGCNMSCWRGDALKIKGFDESFEGWGHEDADFVFRLESLGIRRISGSFATEVLHLWHKTQPSDKERVNRERVLDRIQQHRPSRLG